MAIPDGVKSGSVPQYAALHEILGNFFDEEGNSKTGRVPIDNLIAQIIASDLYQQAGIGVSSFTDLPVGTEADIGRIAYVFQDADVTKNGIYVFTEAEEWEKQRSFPDTATTLVSVGGTANAITASYLTGVDPSLVVMGIIIPLLTNTGPATINGQPVTNWFGGPLGAGELLANRATTLMRTGTGWRVLTPAPYIVPHRGPWNSATQYYAGQAASYNGSSYIALLDNINVQPNTSVVTWALWAERGPVGSGTGDMLAENDLSDVDDPVAAFNNIKQLATTSYAGVVGLADGPETVAGAADDLAITPAGLQDRVATAAEYRSNSPGLLLTTDQVVAAADWVNLVDASVIAIDLNAGINFQVSPAAARQFGNPSNAGKTNYTFSIKVTAGGAHAHTFGSAFKFSNGVAPVFSQAAGKIDLIVCQVFASNFILTQVINDIR